MKSLPKSVLHVSGSFLPHQRAGTEYYCRNLCHALQEQGIGLRILTAVATDQREEEYSLRTRTFEGLEVDEMLIPEQDIGMEWNKELPRILPAYLDKWGIELVHVHNAIEFSPSLYQSLGRLPIVTHLHDLQFLCANNICVHSDGGICDGPESTEKCAHCQGLKPGAPDHAALLKQQEKRLSMMRGVFSRLDLAISPSQFSMTMHRRFDFRARWHMVQGLGLPPMRTPVATSRGKELTVGYLGGVCWFKGLDLLVGAFSALQPVKAGLEIYGKVANEPYFEQAMSMAQGNVVHKGGYAPEDLPGILANLDIVVVPSRIETYSFVAREALAGGCPVIVADAGALPEAVDEGRNGLIFKSGDAAHLGTVLGKLLRDPELIRRMRDNIRTSPAPASIAADAERILELYGCL